MDQLAINSSLTGYIYLVIHIYELSQDIWHVTKFLNITEIMTIVYLFVCLLAYMVFNSTSAEIDYYCQESVKIKLVKKKSIVVNCKM